MENENQLKKKFKDKETLMNAIAKNKKLPTEMLKEKEKLMKEIQANDINNIVPRTHVDDEYQQGIYKPPQIMLTTCRDSSSRLITFVKEISLFFPNSTRINRGGYVVKDLVSMCTNKGFSDLIIVHEHRGEPDGLIISHFPVGPTVYFGIKNCVIRHDLKDKLQTVTEQYPHLVFDNFKTQLGQRVQNVIQHLFPIAKFDSKRIVTFSNSNDIISVRNHSFEKPDYKTVDLNEIGPRFDLKIYQISLGLIDQKEATKEWVLRPYMNKQKNLL